MQRVLVDQRALVVVWFPAICVDNSLRVPCLESRHFLVYPYYGYWRRDFISRGEIIFAGDEPLEAPSSLSEVYTELKVVLILGQIAAQYINSELMAVETRHSPPPGIITDSLAHETQTKLPWNPYSAYDEVI